MSWMFGHLAFSVSHASDTLVWKFKVCASFSPAMSSAVLPRGAAASAVSVFFCFFATLHALEKEKMTYPKSG